MANAWMHAGETQAASLVFCVSRARGGRQSVLQRHGGDTQGASGDEVSCAPRCGRPAIARARRKRNHRTVPLTIGEVHTGLLLTSAAVPVDITVELLAIVPGGSVRTRQRPIRCAWSPEVLTGVDCLAPLSDHGGVRIVGTPATQVLLTDGHIVQAVTHATFRHDASGRRRPWSHYLAQPGVLEILGKAPDESLASGFLRGPSTATDLNLGGVNVRALASIQRSDYLDHTPPFPSRRTRLRWSAETSDDEQEIAFTLGVDGLRTVRLRSSEPDPRALADFCADLALHDWLLSTLLDLVDRAVARSRPAAELIGMLRPGIDHLVHAWMPTAPASRTLDRIWQELDLRSGFSLQWQKTVERIRDQLSVGLIEALRSYTESTRTESI
jgi:hypothetical protein